MVTLAGSGVWEANAGEGEMTPEINVMMLKQERKKRFQTSLLTFIDRSPQELMGAEMIGTLSLHFTARGREVKV